MEILDILKDLWGDIDHAAWPTAEVLGPGIRPLKQVLLLPRDLDVAASDQAVCLDKVLGEGGGHCCRVSWTIHSDGWSAAVSSVDMSRQGRANGWPITWVNGSATRLDKVRRVWGPVVRAPCSLCAFPPAGPPLAVMCFLACKVVRCTASYGHGVLEGRMYPAGRVSPVMPASHVPNDAATACRSLPRVAAALGLRAARTLVSGGLTVPSRPVSPIGPLD